MGADVREYALDSVAAASLYQATAGNPLYVVETVRAGDMFHAPGRDYDKHTPPPATPASYAGLPPKVYAVIEARLAQLSPGARTLAHVAATIGRAFTLTLLAEAGRGTKSLVVAGLDELWRRRIVREQASARYDFTHDRIRDVAYATSSPVKRAHLHKRVAQALEKLHAPDLDQLAGELGMHYQEAGGWREAFAYFRQAAAVARNLYAHREEADYLQKAIATAQNLSSDEETTAAEIELWLELGSVQDLIHGWSSELAATAFQKADELAAQAGNLTYRCEALGQLTVTAWNRGQWHKARELNVACRSPGARTRRQRFGQFSVCWQRHNALPPW